MKSGNINADSQEMNIPKMLRMKIRIGIEVNAFTPVGIGLGKPAKTLASIEEKTDMSTSEKIEITPLHLKA